MTRQGTGGGSKVERGRAASGALGDNTHSHQGFRALLAAGAVQLISHE